MRRETPYTINCDEVTDQKIWHFGNQIRLIEHKDGSHSIMNEEEFLVHSAIFQIDMVIYQNPETRENYDEEPIPEWVTFTASGEPTLTSALATTCDTVEAEIPPEEEISACVAVPVGSGDTTRAAKVTGQVTEQPTNLTLSKKGKVGTTSARGKTRAGRPRFQAMSWRGTDEDHTQCNAKGHGIGTENLARGNRTSSKRPFKGG
jgi:hypothetical protein